MWKGRGKEKNSSKEKPRCRKKEKKHEGLGRGIWHGGAAKVSGEGLSSSDLLVCIRGDERLYPPHNANTILE